MRTQKITKKKNPTREGKGGWIEGVNMKNEVVCDYSVQHVIFFLFWRSLLEDTEEAVLYTKYQPNMSLYITYNNTPE